jgi:hypothetical protein
MTSKIIKKNFNKLMKHIKSYQMKIAEISMINKYYMKSQKMNKTIFTITSLLKRSQQY